MDLALMQMHMRRSFVCPICHKLFTQVTIIEQCRHRFCYECILTKIKEEGIHSCPVCNVDLGSAPLQRLRIDHSWQNKMDSFIERKSEDMEGGVVRETTYISEDSRKEMRKGFDIVASSTPFPNQSKKRAFYPSINTQIPEASSYAHTSMRINENEKYICDEFKSKQYFQNNNIEEERKSSENMRDVWRALMEHGMSYPIKHAQEEQAKHLVTKDENVAFSSQLQRSRELSATHQDEENPINFVGFGEFKYPTKLVVDDNINYKCNEKVVTFWFSLVASNNQKSKAPLEQIPSRYLRVRDGNITISSIKKYIMQKLNLRSENEVEISLEGRLLLPNLQMRKLVDLWLQTTAASERKRAFVGSSAHDFVLTLTYARRPLST